MDAGPQPRGGRRRGPPPWWPEGQSWPPRSPEEWRRSGRRMARRVGCVAGVVLLLLGAVGTGLVWLVLSAVGVVGSAPFARVLSAAGLLLGILAVVLAVLVLRRLAAPAGRLVEAAHRVEAGDFSARVPVRGPSELRSLARAFNAMSGRLEAEEVRRRSVLADVAHELRTPLTIIRGHAEGITDGIYPAEPAQMLPILAATRTLEGIVEQLRIVALADAGSLRPAHDPVDVPALVGETLDAFRSTAEAGGVRLTGDVEPDVPTLDGDAARLRGVLGNLLANALRHTPRGGSVQVGATTRENAAVLTVRDDGEGIAADLLPRVFDRFVRGPSSTGSGLGLAIVRDVVEAHGGSVTARSGPGEGTVVEVILPLTHAAGREQTRSEPRTPPASAGSADPP